MLSLTYDVWEIFLACVLRNDVAMALIRLLDMCDPAESVLLRLSPMAADPCSVPCRIDCSIFCGVTAVGAVSTVWVSKSVAPFVVMLDKFLLVLLWFLVFIFWLPFETDCCRPSITFRLSSVDN